MTNLPTNSLLRPFRDGDQPDLVLHANNPHVARYLRDLFPQPYTLADADHWIHHAARQQPAQNLAMCHAGKLIGGIGLAPGNDIHRISAEIGYWLGEPFWGRGITTAAVIELTAYAFATFPELNRLFAYVDDEHKPSIRVLEKAGFRREGHLLGAAIKHGRIHNQFLYAVTRTEIAR